MMVGERLRDVRHAQHLSLMDVASKAGISAATLSRIETDKQGIDLGLFLTLANILKTVPHELLGYTTPEKSSDPLVRKIAALGSSDRVRMWRDLSAARKSRSRIGRAELSQQVEELVAQFEYMKQEIESVQLGLKRRR